MKYVEYKIAKNFEEVLKNRDTFFEVLIFNENGYGVKRRLIKASYQTNDSRYVTIVMYDKWGRWLNNYSIYVQHGNNQNNDVKNNFLYHYNGTLTTSRDYAYTHCMDVLKSKMIDLRRKASKLHESIYTL
jgi:hypothetical protein